MRLREFGEDKSATWEQESLEHSQGNIADLISIESEKRQSPMNALRLDIVCEAEQLLQIAIEASPRIMEATALELRAFNKRLNGRLAARAAIAKAKGEA